jgi:hypothetical protein
MKGSLQSFQNPEDILNLAKKNQEVCPIFSATYILA